MKGELGMKGDTVTTHPHKRVSNTCVCLSVCVSVCVIQCREMMERKGYLGRLVEKEFLENA